MSTLVSTNPANNQVLGNVNITSDQEIIDKVKQAEAARAGWKKMGVQKRIEILRKVMTAFKEREHEIAELTVKEMGKTITETLGDLVWDFDYFEDFLTQGPKYIEDEITVQDGKATHRIVYEPRGIVACIVPWNFPFANFVWGVIPNLIVGNTVIFKHSEECPLVGKLIEDIMECCKELPIGVFAEIYGSAAAGETLVNQNIHMIWFTGSSKVGKSLFEIAGKKQIKAVLEMGGSNPAIIFDDVNIDEVIAKVYRGRFTNCGQVCDAIKRLIVHKNIFNEFTAKMTDYVNKIKIGDPQDKSTELGPLAAMRQVDLLESQVNDSIKAGARVLTGGKRVSNETGAYYMPTILVDITSDMRVWHEEIFGPVLPIVSFSTEEEAIVLANDTHYGLGATIHSADVKRARRVAADIEAGFVDINDGNHWRPANPFGGYKSSGMGCEHGRSGFHELCQFKVVAEE